MKFTLLHRSKKSQARVGQIDTEHGVIHTPNFIPVGTNGTVKMVAPPLLDSLDIQLLFCNTYHLMLQPGVEIIRKAGGLHHFIHRDRPIISDSGGFQLFSLIYHSVTDELKNRKQKSYHSVLRISDEGVLFRSYRDGKKLLLTPENSIETQKVFGSDIILPLDELPPYHISPDALQRSLHRTHAWEKRSLNTHLKNPQKQAIYGIIHGGVDKSLRAHSCSFLTQLPFDGFAIGGSMGRSKEEMLEMLRFTLPLLPSHLPIHLLGIGDTESIERSISLGIDTFDSSYPTRAARHGTLLTHQGMIKIARTLYADQFKPIENGCLCPTCQHHTRSYLHHLFKARESVATALASIHNLHFMNTFMRGLRQKIIDGLI